MPDELVFLDLSEVVRLHTHQIEVYGGGPGIRDLAMLESALAMPQAAFGEDYLHHDIFAMASAYLFHICQNHPFVDGNKRVAAAAAFSFLYLNGWVLRADQESFRDLVMATASGKKDKNAISVYLKAYSKRQR